MKNGMIATVKLIKIIYRVVGAGMARGLVIKDENGTIVYDLVLQEMATRAQMASILMKFCDAYEV